MNVKVATSTEEASKVYDEKPYFNSNKDPFGVTLKGKTKLYIAAHKKVKEMVIKNKVITTSMGKIKFIEVNQKPGFVNAIVEVADESEMGNAEIKIYNPSLSKKKGATIEMRKCPDYDYAIVDKLKDIVASLLDKYLVENESNGCKVFTCDVCQWQTRFEPALKGHKKRMHGKAQSVKGEFVCDGCEFTTVTNDLLILHKNNKHKAELKRQKTSFKCTVTGCNSTFYYERNLSEHKRSQHAIKTDKRETLHSPTSSPPRKRFEKEIEENEADMLNLDEMEIIVEKEISRKFMFEKKIKELEVALLEERRERERLKAELEKKEFESTSKNKSKVLKEPVRVKNEHIKHLKGFKWRYPIRGDGRCLENCTAIHKYGNEDQGMDVRILINEHVAGNWNYWKNKLPLPYKESIYIEGMEKAIEKKTDEEMINFLKFDEDALKVYSGGYTLNAIANLYNIKIHIFTYEGDHGNWNVVFPDPEVATPAESEMFLYHSKENHYELLVNDTNITFETKNEAMSDMKENSEGWKVFKSKTGKKKVNTKENESDKVMVDTKDIDEEQTLMDGKKTGYRRTTPQDSAEVFEKTDSIFTCKKCDKKLESQGLLVAHMADTHNQQSFQCEECEQGFKKRLDLEMHKIETHENRETFVCDFCAKVETSKSLLDEHLQIHRAEETGCAICGKVFSNQRNLDIHALKHRNYKEWNCNDCPFQASSADELIKHLKLSGHQPSENIKDNRKSYNDYKQCYTCKLEFDGYWNLMEHRKSVHPSNKRCRYYPDGKCVFGIKCWYIHEEHLMDVDESFTTQDIKFKCNFCDFESESKDRFMKHKKDSHRENVSKCNNFISGNCKRTDSNCWYIHNHVQKHEGESSKQEQDEIQQQVFRGVQEGLFPPDQVMQMMMETFNKMYMKMFQDGKIKNMSN